MPLSEHEQRILAELEESLVRHDPEFAERVRSDTVYRHAGRHAKLAAAGFVVGLAILVGFFPDSVAAGLAGVVVMFVSLVVLERNVRRIGKVGWWDLSTRRRSTNDAPAAERAARDWFRHRLFRRDH